MELLAEFGGRYTDAGLARVHTLSLLERGMSLKRIAAVTGLSHGGLSKLIYGTSRRPPSRRVTYRTEDILTELELDVADGATVDRTEADEIIEELRGRGWTKAAIALALGSKTPALQVGKYGGVTAGKLRRLRSLLYLPVPTRYDRNGNVRRLPHWEWSYPDPTTEGVPEPTRYAEIRREAWLNDWRQGLKLAVEASRTRDAETRRLSGLL